LGDTAICLKTMDKARGVSKWLHTEFDSLILCLCSNALVYQQNTKRREIKTKFFRLNNPHKHMLDKNFANKTNIRYVIHGRWYTERMYCITKNKVCFVSVWGSNRWIREQIISLNTQRRFVFYVKLIFGDCTYELKCNAILSRV
jgi:hypothetical protein